MRAYLTIFEKVFEKYKEKAREEAENTYDEETVNLRNNLRTAKTLHKISFSILFFSCEPKSDKKYIYAM